MSFIYDDSEQKKLTNINVYVKSNGNLTEYTQSVYNNINDYNFITINNVPYKTDGSRLYSYTDFEKLVYFRNPKNKLYFGNYTSIKLFLTKINLLNFKMEKGYLNGTNNPGWNGVSNELSCCGS